MKYYLTGIKGSGMTALACILKDMGHHVIGSDVDHVYFTDAKLAAKNIPVLPFDMINITPDIDCLILGNAYPLDHPEVLIAKELAIKIMPYYEFVAQLAKQYHSVAIAGTNGKTTTTGLISTMLQAYQPMVLIGDGTGIGHAEAKYFVYEACEYKNTFHHYFSQVGLINNIEMDHPDFFVNLEQVLASYQKFANQCKTLVINLDDNNCQKIIHPQKITFGINNHHADVLIKNVVKKQAGFQFDLVIFNQNIGQFFLPFQGQHMLYNSLAAIAIAVAMELDLSACINDLALFHGTTRRFEISVLDEESQIILVDDYAHHPTAINYTLSAIKQKYPGYTISVIFQPHTYSRTKAFVAEFAQSLSAADHLYLAAIFGSVRENQTDFDINILVNAVKALGHPIEKDLDFIKNIKRNHVIAVLGAGNVDRLYIPQIKKLVNKG